MDVPQRNKDSITITISPYYGKKLEELTEDKTFSSKSEIGAIAIQRFIDEINAIGKLNSSDANPVTCAK